jgi:hypothetical protein
MLHVQDQGYVMYSYVTIGRLVSIVVVVVKEAGKMRCARHSLRQADSQLLSIGVVQICTAGRITTY